MPISLWVYFVSAIVSIIFNLKWTIKEKVCSTLIIASFIPVLGTILALMGVTDNTISLIRYFRKLTNDK